MRWLAAGFLLLAGCGDDRPISRSEAENIAEDFATDTSDLEGRIAALEREVARLSGEQSRDINMLADMTRAYADDGKAQDDELRRLDYNQDVLFENVNYLRALQGRPPIPGTKPSGQ